MSDSLAELVQAIQTSHLDQLAQQEIHVPSFPEEDPPPTIFSDVRRWIEDNKGAIEAAKKTQCHSASPDSPNWDAVLISIIESSAMYLRKSSEMKKAIHAAQTGDYEAAGEHLKKSQKEIDTIAEDLGCTFVQLCDFSKQSYEGTWIYSGAFCGVFISKDTGNPFMGLAFKGTNNVLEASTDRDWNPIDPAIIDVAWGAKMHRGFYNGLFGRFKVGSSYKVPYDLIQSGLAGLYEKQTNKALLHVTGHSLGGGYCTITYGEFLRRQGTAPTSNFKFGGYVFSCLGLLRGAGKFLFRIVNHNDPITTVPPVKKDQLAEYPFVHVGGAWEIFGDRNPIRMSDEPPPVDPKPIKGNWWTWRIKDHMLGDYYAGWQKAPHTAN